MIKSQTLEPSSLQIWNYFFHLRFEFDSWYNRWKRFYFIRIWTSNLRFCDDFVRVFLV